MKRVSRSLTATVCCPLEEPSYVTSKTLVTFMVGYYLFRTNKKGLEILCEMALLSIYEMCR